MRTASRLATAVAVAVVSLAAPPAQAQIAVEVKDWHLSVSGGAGGFATMTFCDKSALPAAPVAGTIACAVGKDGHDRTAVESGLMPGFINFQAKTTSGEWELGGDIGLFSGLNSTGQTGKAGFGNTTTDMRKNYAFFGRKDLGTFKVGRDLALFGSDAIFNDMSLVGAGSGSALPVGFQTTFGRIGVGYLYADWVPQVNYTSPSLSGLQLSVSLIQSWNPFSGAGDALTGHRDPGFQAKATYDLGGTAHVWAGGWYQTAQALGGTGVDAGKSLTTSACELGARVSPVKDLSLVGYFYGGNGAGTTGVGFYAYAWDGAKVAARKSLGYYGQATYALGALKLGASYGASTLDLASNETAASNPGLVKSNSSVIGGLYYALSPNLTLTGEWTTTASKTHGGTKLQDNSIALGSYIFF